MSRPAYCLLLVGLSVLFQGGAFGADLDKDPNLIGYWALDEGTGTTAYDLSGKGNNGTLSCTSTGTLPIWAAGMFGSAVQFNGSNNYINCGNAAIFNVTGQVTLAAWVYPATAATVSHEGYITKGDTTYTLKEANTLGNVEMNIYSGGWHTATMTGRTAANNNTWYHLAGTFDGSNIKLYLNGTVAATTAWAGPIATNTDSVNIGRDSNGGGGRRYFNGRIDDARIYNRALTDVEVAALLVNNRASNPTPASNSTDQNRDGLTLSWTPGGGAAKHNVYFGTAADALASVSSGQDASTFSLGRLEFGTTYYWRVDEVAADGTVVEGYLWQFTVEPDMYAIAAASITATASGSITGSEPINTINRSGLTGDLHGVDSKTMWVSGPATGAVWIQYNFDRLYKLQQMLVWNYNTEFESMLGFGVMNATVQYSADGTNFTNLGDFVFNQADSAADYKYNTTVDFGALPVKAVKILINSNYGGQQYGLSEVRFLYTRAWATVPSPATAATGVVPNTTLSWRAGRDAASHTVYLGTDPNALSVAATTSAATYTPAGLNLGTTYYWKVDEVNGASVWTSDVWSFTTSPYFVVDDMESYNDGTNRIFDTWVDGFGTTNNGAIVGLTTAANGTFGSTTIYNGGKQSMPFAYTNTGGMTNSEATRTFTAAQNWTLFNAKVLTLYLYGQGTNTTTIPLWVKLTDQGGKNAKVTFGAGAGEDTAVIGDLAWTTWSIPMSSFTGVDASKVKSMTIGLGSGSGSGTLYIDDVRLYAVAPAGPIAATLVGWWKLDNDLKDSSGKGNNGTIGGAPTYVAAGKIGASMKFNGTADYIDCGAGTSLDITDQVTLSAWIKPTDITASGYHDIVGKGDMAYALRVYTSQVQFYFYYSAGWHQFNSPTYTSAFSSIWHHVAATYDGVQARIYVDGAVVASGFYTGGIATATANVSIGRNTTSTGRWYSGELDDVRVYRGVLPTSEVKKLANP
jgi:hypothetical protein